MTVQLGLKEYLEKAGHELIVSASKEGADSDFQKHLPDVMFSVVRSLCCADRFTGRDPDHDALPSGMHVVGYDVPGPGS